MTKIKREAGDADDSSARRDAKKAKTPNSGSASFGGSGASFGGSGAFFQQSSYGGSSASIKKDESASRRENRPASAPASAPGQVVPGLNGRKAQVRESLIALGVEDDRV